PTTSTPLAERPSRASRLARPVVSGMGHRLAGALCNRDESVDHGVDLFGDFELEEVTGSDALAENQTRAKLAEALNANRKQTVDVEDRHATVRRCRGLVVAQVAVPRRYRDVLG